MNIENKIVNLIIEDLKSRKSLGNFWNACDKDVQEEIISQWENLIKPELYPFRNKPIELINKILKVVPNKNYYEEMLKDISNGVYDKDIDEVVHILEQITNLIKP